MGNARNFLQTIYQSEFVKVYLTCRARMFSVYNWQAASCDASTNNIVTSFWRTYLQRKRKSVWRKYEEIQWRWRQSLRNVQIKTAFGKIGKLCNEIDVGSIEGKQLDLCKRSIIFCHVDCFCLQEKKGRWSQKYFSVSNTEATASATIKFFWSKWLQSMKSGNVWQ